MGLKTRLDKLESTSHKKEPTFEICYTVFNSGVVTDIDGNPVDKPTGKGAPHIRLILTRATEESNPIAKKICDPILAR